MKFGETIYVVAEFDHFGTNWQMLFWSKDLEFVKDWIEQNENSDTYFEYFEVKHLVEW